MNANHEILFRKIMRLGFSVFPHERDGQICMMRNICRATTPSQDELVAVLNLLNPSYRLEFFDHYFPSVPDPGAYCTAVVVKPGTVAYWEGGLDWRQIPAAEFAALMQLNWRKGDKFGHYENYFTLMENIFGFPS